VVRSDSKIDEVWSEKLREKVEGRDGGRKKKEERKRMVSVRGWVSVSKKKALLHYLQLQKFSSSKMN